MVKPLSFKGDKKQRKRKREVDEPAPTSSTADPSSSSKELTTTQATTDPTAVDEDDTWTTAEAPSDLAGPVVIALPTSPPTCIATDANGKVFCSELENIIEGDTSTAEPHDVRQVWVANRVAGTEGVSLKGWHGKYLKVDKFGILSATRDAISAEEQHVFIPSPDTPGTFSMQTAREKFLAVSEDTKVPEVRGDAEAVSFATTFRVRMQSRFKPKLRASKESRAREKISRKELEEVVGRRLDEEEVRRLKKARREGTYHEAILDVRVSGKHDKFAS